MKHRRVAYVIPGVHRRLQLDEELYGFHGALVFRACGQHEGRLAALRRAMHKGPLRNGIHHVLEIPRAGRVEEQILDGHRFFFHRAGIIPPQPREATRTVSCHLHRCSLEVVDGRGAEGEPYGLGTIRRPSGLLWITTIALPEGGQLARVSSARPFLAALFWNLEQLRREVRGPWAQRFVARLWSRRLRRPLPEGVGDRVLRSGAAAICGGPRASQRHVDDAGFPGSNRLEARTRVTVFVASALAWYAAVATAVCAA
mmetsp:Transcript_108161/g.304645  ORF Transcript_108161/g.304645 Transcript_108161/m.304645 type:complete len:257 (+) Transcript_108161:735-1505(+)